MTIQHLSTLPLVDALYWFIENVDEENPDRNEMFFHLRERVRDQGRTHPDNATVAYIAMGAQNAIRAWKDAHGHAPDFDGVGEDGFIDQLTDYALMLDRMADDAGNNFDGVFNYEVAEPFGEQCANALLNGTTPAWEDLGRALLAKITR